MSKSFLTSTRRKKNHNSRNKAFLLVHYFPILGNCWNDFVGKMVGCVQRPLYVVVSSIDDDIDIAQYWDDGRLSAAEVSTHPFVGPVQGKSGILCTTLHSKYNCPLVSSCYYRLNILYTYSFTYSTTFCL